MTEDRFVAALSESGANPDIAIAISDGITVYYGRATTPHVDDRMKGDIGIDPGDVEDFVLTFFKKNRLSSPTRRNPERLPDYRTATSTSFAFHLQQRTILSSTERNHA